MLVQKNGDLTENRLGKTNFSSSRLVCDGDKSSSGLGGVLLQGASTTTSAYLQTLVLALVQYPEVQRKAHEEIDRVVGSERAPTIQDLESMPYIRAIINEVLPFLYIAD